MVCHAMMDGALDGISMASSNIVQFRRFAKYLRPWLDDNLQSKKVSEMNSREIMCFAERLLGKHFPGKSLIRYNADVAIIVTLMSVTGLEITFKHIEGVFDKFKNETRFVSHVLHGLQSEIGFVWPPESIGTFDCDDVVETSVPVHRDVLHQLKLFVAESAATERASVAPAPVVPVGTELSPDEEDVIGVLMSMNSVGSNSKKRALPVSDDVVDEVRVPIVSPVHEIGRGESAFRPYKKPSVERDVPTNVATNAPTNVAMSFPTNQVIDCGSSVLMPVDIYKYVNSNCDLYINLSEATKRDINPHPRLMKPFAWPSPCVYRPGYISVPYELYKVMVDVSNKYVTWAHDSSM